MSRSSVSICNQALGFLGQNLITSLDDATDEATMCKAFYAYTVDAMLELRDWTFARKIARMVPSATPPDHSYANYFILPSDCLTIRRVGTTDYFNDINMDWERHSDKIAANFDVIYLKYTARIADPAKFSELFSLALAARLALYMAKPLTEDDKTLANMQTLFNGFMGEAQAIDGMQEPQQRLRTGPLLNLRRTGVYGLYNTTR